jgi:plasmid maintenance system antidote protein VapI
MPDDLAKPFDPDWCVAPAATLRAWMKEKAVTSQHLAVRCAGAADLTGYARDLIADVLGRRPLTTRHATALARGTGIPATFWLRLEENYRADLATGRTGTTLEDHDA